MPSKACIALLGIVIAFVGFLLKPIDNFSPNPQALARFLEYHPLLFNDDALNKVRLIKSDALEYPEDLDVDQSTDTIYTGLVDGSIARIRNEKIDVIAKGKDIILGVKLSKDLKHLYFADTGAGICRLDLSTNEIEVLTDSYNGEKFMLPNGVDVADNGKVYFTVTSNKTTFHNFTVEFLESRANGRLFSYDLETRQTELLLDGLYFPNGLALSNDQSYLVFAETTAFRITRYVIKGEKKGKKYIVVKDLPGAPDNVKFNEEGLLWAAFPSWKSKLSDTLGKSIVARTILAKLPEWLRKMLLVEKNFAGGAVIDVPTESIIKFVRTNQTDTLLCITTMLQKGNKLYLGSIMQRQIGIVEISPGLTKYKE